MKHTLTMLLMGMALCGGVHAQHGDTARMTLDSCLRYAYGHSYNVQNARLGSAQAANTLRGAKLQFLPSVNASASQGMSWNDNTTRSGNYGLSANLTLFNGLNNVLTLRQSKVQAEQRELMVRQAENNVGVQIVAAYLTILMNKERLVYQQEVLETSHQQQVEGEVKYQVGRILESDYLLLEANYLSAQSEIENTRLTIADNRYQLATLLMMDGGAVVDVVPGEDTADAQSHSIAPYDSLVTQARGALPDWQISQLAVDIARYNVGIARSAFMPSLSLGAGTSYNEGSIISDNPTTTINGGLNTSVTATLSIPILNRGASLTQYKQSKLNLQQAELDNRQAMIDIEKDIESLYIQATQALNRYRVNEALAHAYRSSYEVYVLKFAEGAVTAVEMLQQQDKYLSALNDYLQSKYSYLLAEKQLDIYTGKEIKL